MVEGYATGAEKAGVVAVAVGAMWRGRQRDTFGVYGGYGTRGWWVGRCHDESFRYSVMRYELIYGVGEAATVQQVAHRDG